jgi:MoaA/NifB/PqqE/SkfB family radical SAM enzyme
VATKRDSSIAFEASIADILRTALRVWRHTPGFAIRAIRLLRQQHAAASKRRKNEDRGVHVPPFVIYSITAKCNLDCEGCYANILHRSDDRPELPYGRVEQLLAEASDLGVSIMLMAGGEPLMHEGLLELTADRPEILFLLFTNGTLLDEEKIDSLRRQRHVVPILSLEGDKDLTDARRGSGTHEYILRSMDKLTDAKIFFGTSITLTRANFEHSTDQSLIAELIDCGCRLFFYINYIPVRPGTEQKKLSPEQVRTLRRRIEDYSNRLPGLFVAFPEEEVKLGGCLAAGRGFIHINAYGDVEPCPFSPYSDTNLAEVSLEQALGSPLFARILDSGVVLDESDGQCALWKRRQWVECLLNENLQKDERKEVSAKPQS